MNLYLTDKGKSVQCDADKEVISIEDETDG